MSKIVTFHKAAKQDIFQICDWYASKREGLDREFLFHLEEIIARLRLNSEMYPVYYRNTQRVPVHRFPYALYYRLVDDAIRIVALYHCSRYPSTWRKRK